MKDAEFISLADKAKAFAARIKKDGGVCDCLGARYGASFVVKMRDGRIFFGCGIHGAGGRITPSVDAVERARGMGPSLRLYLVDRWFGQECIVVEQSAIESIALDTSPRVEIL